MNQLIQLARGSIDAGVIASFDAPRCAVLSIDGYRWTSPVPENAGEAETFNRIAERLISLPFRRAEVAT